MRTWRALAPLCLIALAGAGLAGAGDKGKEKKLAEITGTIEYKKDIDVRFGPDTIATVTLQDVSVADVKAKVLGKSVLKDMKTFPIPFKVTYDPADIRERGRYSLGVRITTKDKLEYINDTSIPVITGGHPTKDVKAPVIRVGKK
jgi:putative lipoprotein